MEELWEFFAGEEARRYRRTFSRVGAAMLAMILLPVGAQLLLQALLLAWAPALLEDTVFLYTVSAFTTYGIGFPAAMLVLLLIQYLVLYWVEAGHFSALPSALGHAFLGAGVTFAVSVVILSLNSVRSGRSRRRQW